MHFTDYYPIDVVNGLGTRSTLFVAGCIHQCRGCFNQETWSPRAGSPFTQDMEDKIIADLSNTFIPRRGLSLLGGDPLFPGNLDAVLKLVKRVKAECPDKDIWIWTGYKLEELSEKQNEIVSLIDVLIDGKFEKDLYDPSLKWRGSSNQIIHQFSR